MYTKTKLRIPHDLPRKSIGPVFPGRTFSVRPPLKGCPHVRQLYCNAPAVTILRVPSKETCYVYVVDQFHQFVVPIFLCIRIITKPRLRYSATFHWTELVTLYTRTLSTRRKRICNAIAFVCKTRLYINRRFAVDGHLRCF